MCELGEKGTEEGKLIQVLNLRSGCKPRRTVTKSHDQSVSAKDSYIVLVNIIVHRLKI
jgi:hypothetical protein